MVKVDNGQEMAQSERNSHSYHRGGKQLSEQSGTCTIVRKHTVSRMSCYFHNRRPLSYPNPTKNMKIHTYVMCKQHKNPTPKHKTIRTITMMSICLLSGYIPTHTPCSLPRLQVPRGWCCHDNERTQDTICC